MEGRNTGPRVNETALRPNPPDLPFTPTVAHVGLGIGRIIVRTAMCVWCAYELATVLADPRGHPMAPPAPVVFRSDMQGDSA